jgi:hypothetical protein
MYTYAVPFVLPACFPELSLSVLAESQNLNASAAVQLQSSDKFSGILIGASQLQAKSTAYMKHVHFV